MVERQVPIEADRRLDRCEAKGAAISWPIPLDNLLDALVDAADDAGMKTTRKELAAAIVLAAPREGEVLSKIVTRYRKAKVADVVPEVPADNVVPFHIRKPGPRPKRSEA
jgi:hypothetical protein